MHKFALNIKNRRMLTHYIKSTVAICFALSLIACSSNDDEETNNGNSALSVTLPSAGSEAAAFVIDTSGGDGGTGAGGSGGTGANIKIDLFNGAKGRLEVLDNGLAMPAISMTSYTAATGDNAATVSSNTTIGVVTTKPAVDTLYMVADDTNLYKATSSATFPDPAEIVTGLSIASSAVLTLELNTNGSTMAELVFEDDISNDGQIITIEQGSQRGDLFLWAHNYVATGKLISTGVNAGAPNGGDITLITDAHIYNAGDIDASGFEVTGVGGGNGGNAGAIFINSTGVLENSGEVNASGGKTIGAGSNGGNAGDVSLYSGYGHIYNQGALSSMGGDGDNAGGDGADINVLVSKIGDLLNSGVANSSGGTGSADAGGQSGVISYSAKGGKLINSANLLANGGNGADGFSGGDAGSITLNTSSASDFDMPTGNLIVSGNMSAKGGSATGTAGGVGGKGGTISLSGNTGFGEHPKSLQTQLLGLWGYSSLMANGGSGEKGKNAGTISISSYAGDSTDYADNWGWVSAASINNEASLQTVGGGATAVAASGNFSAGQGGSVKLSTFQVGAFDSSTVSNSGSINTMSGQDLRSTGILSSGSVTLSAPGGVENSAVINSSGSNDASVANAGVTANGSNAFGNYAGDIELSSSNGNVINSGNLTANGGDAEVTGGKGAKVTLIGATVSNSGVINANGGDSLETGLSNSAGGDGGRITLIAKQKGQATNSAAMTQEGGSGAKSGERSHLFMVDGY